MVIWGSLWPFGRHVGGTVSSISVFEFFGDQIGGMLGRNGNFSVSLFVFSGCPKEVYNIDGS